MHYCNMALNVPVFEFQHRSTGKQQDIKLTASIAAAKTLIKIYRRSRYKLLVPAQDVKHH